MKLTLKTGIHTNFDRINEIFKRENNKVVIKLKNNSFYFVIKSVHSSFLFTRDHGDLVLKFSAKDPSYKSWETDGVKLTDIIPPKDSFWNKMITIPINSGELEIFTDKDYLGYNLWEDSSLNLSEEDIAKYKSFYF